MSPTAVADELLSSYQSFEALLGAIGQGVDEGQVVESLAQDELEKETIEACIHREAEGDACVPPLRPEAAERMRKLVAELAAELVEALPGEGKDPAGAQDTERLARKLGAMPDATREALADVVAQNGHRRYVRPRYMAIEDFRQLVADREQETPFALGRLAPYLRDELRKRGFEYSLRQIVGFLRPGGSVTEVPCCLGRIMSGLNGECRACLIPLEEMVGDGDPDAWLEGVREKLLFRSHSAMHKAIADMSGLKYDCVHKALSGRQKAKRIQADVKYWIEAWLGEAQEGGEPSVDDEYRAVPIEKACELLPALLKRYGTKECVYREIARRTGIRAGSVRRCFQPNGQLKCAPLAVYRCAQELGDGQVAALAVRESYLSDRRTLQVATELSRRAYTVLHQLRRAGPEASELEIEFRELRLELIAAIKEGWRRLPATA